jgi:hypothetical protein
MRDGCGGRAGKVDLNTRIEGAGSRPVRRIGQWAGNASSTRIKAKFITLLYVRNVLCSHSRRSPACRQLATSAHHRD